jgi:ABC-type multidrug transport system ATPase subunit
MIRAQNLAKTLGDFTAIKDISFGATLGEIFAFLGPNGAAKTTTIRMPTSRRSPVPSREKARL